MFAIIVERNLRDAAAVKAEGEASLRQWIQRIASSIAGNLGAFLGKLSGTLARILMN